jgi:hypothetical protein
MTDVLFGRVILTIFGDCLFFFISVYLGIENNASFNSFSQGIEKNCLCFNLPRDGEYRPFSVYLRMKNNASFFSVYLGVANNASFAKFTFNIVSGASDSKWLIKVIFLQRVSKFHYPRQ